MKDPHLLTSEQFQKFFGLQVDLVHEWMKDKPTMMPPHFIIHGMNPEMKKQLVVMRIESDFNDHDEKHAIIGQLAQRLFDMYLVPLAVAVTSEAWMVIRSPQALKSMAQPSTQPDKRETLILAARALGQPPINRSKMWWMERNMNNGIILKNDPKLDGYQEFESGLLDSFYEQFFEIGHAAFELHKPAMER